MKRMTGILLCTVVLFTLLTGCASDPAEIHSEFLTMIEEPATEESIEAIGEFLDKNLGKIETIDADHMAIAYEDYIFTFSDEFLDYRDFSDRFGKYLSKPLANLYEIKAEEQENPMAVDTVLKKSWQQLCGRAMELELFIKEYGQNEPIREDARRIYGYYINAIMMGTTGTPIFDYQEGTFSEEAKNDYVDFAAQYPDTTLTSILNEYFSYLESVDFRLDYSSPTEVKVFFDTCAYLVLESGKRV